MGPWVHGPIQARWAYGPMGPCAAAPSAPLQRTPPHRSLCGGSVGPSAASTFTAFMHLKPFMAALLLDAGMIAHGQIRAPQQQLHRRLSGV